MNVEIIPSIKDVTDFSYILGAVMIGGVLHDYLDSLKSKGDNDKDDNIKVHWKEILAISFLIALAIAGVKDTVYMIAGHLSTFAFTMCGWGYKLFYGLFDKISKKIVKSAEKEAGVEEELVNDDLDDSDEESNEKKSKEKKKKKEKKDKNDKNDNIKND